jgi:hypothetical protein
MCACIRTVYDAPGIATGQTNRSFESRMERWLRPRQDYNCEDSTNRSNPLGIAVALGFFVGIVQVVMRAEFALR